MSTFKSIGQPGFSEKFKKPEYSLYQIIIPFKEDVTNRIIHNDYGLPCLFVTNGGGFGPQFLPGELSAKTILKEKIEYAYTGGTTSSDVYVRIQHSLNFMSVGSYSISGAAVHESNDLDNPNLATVSYKGFFSKNTSESVSIDINTFVDNDPTLKIGSIERGSIQLFLLYKTDKMKRINYDYAEGLNISLIKLPIK